jgi:hypothetical protein
MGWRSRIFKMDQFCLCYLNIKVGKSDKSVYSLQT